MNHLKKLGVGFGLMVASFGLGYLFGGLVAAAIDFGWVNLLWCVAGMLGVVIASYLLGSFVVK